MLIKTHQIKVPMILNLILVFLCVTAPPASAVESRKLDETTVPPPGEKCTPCGNSYPSPPPPVDYPPPPVEYPPPPVEYPPPPVEYPPPSPKPPSPKKTPSKYCPPPPPASLLYITGPPGNLYPVDENFNGATRRSLAGVVPILVGLLSLLSFW